MISAGLAIFIVYTAIVTTSKVIGTDSDTADELPGHIQELIDQVKNQPDPISDHLTMEEDEAAAGILKGFLAAKSVEERVPFVRDAENMKATMEAWYAKNPEEATREWPEPEIKLRRKIVDLGRYFIILKVELTGIGNRYLAIEQSEAGDMRLDWPTMVGYQPVPLVEYQATLPRDPVKFWVKLKPSEFYNFGFSDQQRYRAVELSYPGQLEFKLIGYIDRTKPWAPNLIEMLDDNQAPSLIVELKYPQGEIEDPSQVEIVSVLSNTWWP